MSAISGDTTMAVPSISNDGNWIAQALSASRGHEHERVVAGKEVAYDGFLLAFERVEAEVVFQLFVEILFLCHSNPMELSG